MSKWLAIKREYSSTLWGVVGEDLGLSGAILRRCEAQAGQHSKFPFEESANRTAKDARGACRGKVYKGDTVGCAWWAAIQAHHCGTRGRRGSAGREEAGGHAEESQGSLPAFGKVHCSAPAEGGGSWGVGQWQSSDRQVTAPPISYRTFKGWALILWPSCLWSEVVHSVCAESYKDQGWPGGQNLYKPHTHTPYHCLEDGAHRFPVAA